MLIASPAAEGAEWSVKTWDFPAGYDFEDYHLPSARALLSQSGKFALYDLADKELTVLDSVDGFRTGTAMFIGTGMTFIARQTDGTLAVIAPDKDSALAFLDHRLRSTPGL